MTPAIATIERLKEQAREALGRELADSSLANASEDEEAKAWAIIVRLVEKETRHRAHAGGDVLGDEERRELAQGLFDHFFRLGPLQKFLEDDSVEEVIVNSHDRGFVIRHDGGKKEVHPGFSSDGEVRLLLTRIAARAGRRIDESSPAVEVCLPDGSRMHAVLPPITESPCITIRRHRLKANSLAELVDLGTLTPEAASFLALAVQCGLNILVSGGTGSGKTTTLNALGRAIPPLDRVITIEETLELRFRYQLRDCLALEQRKANAEGVGEISIRQLVRNALRMRPKRIVVGEVRGPEGLDMLSAMNSGHEGSMGTIHANSARQALTKLELSLLQGGEQLTPDVAVRMIAETLNLVVHLKPLDAGKRIVCQISEVVGFHAGQVQINELFRLEHGRLVRTEIPCKALAGLERLPPSGNCYGRA
ncbi:MAG: CpaF family protein [Actinomycetota bacterium]